MAVSHVHRLSLTPPLRLDVQRGTLHMTTGEETFREQLLTRPNYWPSHLPGLGWFTRPPAAGRDSGDDEVLELRLPLTTVLLYPEGNPFDEELQRANSLSSLWRVLPQVPLAHEFEASIDASVEDFKPTISPNWDDIFDSLVEDAAAALKGQGIFRLVPPILRRAHARGRLASRWPEFRAGREAEFARIEEKVAATVALLPSAAELTSLRRRQVQLLLAADPAATQALVADLLGSALVPFQTDLDWMVEGGSAVRMSFSVPAVERIISPTTRALLPNGELRKVKREKEELHRDFITLVVGQAAHFGALLFSRLPKLERLSVAASTQGSQVTGRRGRKSGGENSAGNYHVFDVEFLRADFEGEFRIPFDPMVYLSEHQARVNQISSIALGRIDPPAWISG